MKTFVLSIKILISSLILILFTGCAGGALKPIEVVIIVGEDKEFWTGLSRGGMIGSFTTNSKTSNVKCMGAYQYLTNSSGKGTVNCTDGRTGGFHFERIKSSTGKIAGMGVGSLSDGSSIRFTYGLSLPEVRDFLFQTKSKIKKAPSKTKLKTPNA
tara:strand:+ start:1316 stop:1783 length:468 start_codon:yes stop_codon:yes gene_type:complete